MSKKTGTLIKEARTGAGFTQEQLAKKVTGLSTADLGKAERGEKDLTQNQLREIAKACGVTQKSLLDSAKTSAKPASAKTSSAKKTTAAKTTGSAKKTTTAKKTASQKASSSVTLTAKEKKLLNAYRKADDGVKAKVEQILLSESVAGEMVQQLIEGAIKKLTGK